MHRIVSLCLALLVSGVIAVFAQEAPASLAGKWEINIEFVCGEALHTADFTQKGNTLSGTYKGSVLEGQIRGTARDDTVTFGATLRHQSASAPFNFTGAVKGDVMEGTVSMGEYWNAKFTAKRVGK